MNIKMGESVKESSLLMDLSFSIDSITVHNNLSNYLETIDRSTETESTMENPFSDDETFNPLNDVIVQNVKFVMPNKK